MLFSANAGLGSLTKPVTREMVGRTLRVTASSRLICGVTDMTKPTGTVCGVLVKVVCEVVWLVTVSASRVK